MVGSSKNRERLAAEIRSTGKYARDTPRGVELGKAPGSTLYSEIIWNNGRRCLYLLVRGPQKNLSANIQGNFQETLTQILAILNQIGL